MNLFNKWTRFCLIVAGILLLNCEETLPPYTLPQETLILKPLIASQGTVGPGIPVINILIQGENQYEEVFQDTVSVKGELIIYWENRPDYIRSIPLNNTQFLEPTPILGRTMTLAPGEIFSMQVVWYLDTDDGLYIPDSLEYSDRLVNGLLYAEPITFVLQANLTLFNQLGLLQSEPFYFVFSGFGRVAELDKGNESEEQE